MGCSTHPTSIWRRTPVSAWTGSCGVRTAVGRTPAPGTIQWGRTLTSATANPDGTHLLTFDTGITTEADLVIGADGAWSRVRPLVSDATPVYTGVTFIEAHFDNVDTDHPAVAELVGDGHVFAIARHDTPDQAITAYEQTMLPRAAETGDGTAALARNFGPGDRDRIPDFAEAGKQDKQGAAAYRNQ
ncbi:FAD-dependent monooxygenase [Streptomyces olivoreticuli]